MSNVLYAIDFQHLSLEDLPQVGGKNASIGEMIGQLAHANILVPQGFATTADAFHLFLSQNNTDALIKEILSALDPDDLQQLTHAGKKIRSLIGDLAFTHEFVESIHAAYARLVASIGTNNFSVAVRSSATAEDLPDASFAGQQETYLNITGIESILTSIKLVFASLFNDRAITYRAHHGFSETGIAISAGVQQMIRSDLASSGVMFTLDTESGFRDVIFITSSYGLGEPIVQGAVNPDEFYVHKLGLTVGRPATIRRNLGTKEIKMVYNNVRDTHLAVKTIPVPTRERLQFSLTIEEIETLARHALIIENHYGRPMDIEWAKDGLNGNLYILQARPETVKSRHNQQLQERYTLTNRSKILTEGRSIGQRIGQGRAKIIYKISEMNQINAGDVLVTDMTDPDWEPIMKRAAAIVTNRGGRTCHAAIIARELGIPAVVGCGNATQNIRNNEEITVSCAEGDTGYVYQGKLAFEHIELEPDTMPTNLPVKIMLNVGNPERAFAFQATPNAGVGLARLEFLISNSIGIHPKALLEYATLDDLELKKLIDERTAAYTSPIEFYIERLKEGIATIAAAFYPKPVIVRFSDFKSNEYANLIGGNYFEPHEENPMLGFRGAARYIDPNFTQCFALECQAIRRVRNDMGLTNVEIMIPFVRTIHEAHQVIAVLKHNALERGVDGLRIIMMCEVPSNALLANKFLAYFDGFSIGSNDLTQLTLGIDRDSGIIASQFDERNEAVKVLLHLAISACKKAGKYIGICGQGPSDHQDFAEWLMQEGIDSVSLNPDSVLHTCLFLAKQVA